MKYYSLAPPISTASQIMLNDFNYASNILFENSTDIFTIQKETFGSKTYYNVKARITAAINNLTSRLLGDDFKQIIHNPIDNISIGIGDMYYFSDNYWISVFSDAIKSVVSNGTVRRANNMLKWIDENGVLFQEPCIIDYNILGSRNLTRQDDMVLPQGYIKIFAQLNERTEKIKPGQRFLVGRPNRQVCWRVLGNGEMVSQGLQTIDNESARLLTLVVEAYQYNEQTDDLINGIADAYKLNYSISLPSSFIYGNVSENYPINAILLCNNDPISGSMTYSTSSSIVADISSSGLITLNSAGSAIVKSYMGGNIDISASALVTVTASGTITNEIRITPSDNTFILEGNSQTFTSYLYINGIQQADIFSFVVADSNVPTDRYIINNMTNNSFDVENINMYLNSPLVINAISGSYIKQISILLTGAF